MDESDIERIIGKVLEHNNAALLGQLSGYVDTRITDLERRLSDHFDRLETMVEAIAERVVTDEQERTALGHQVQRHEGWVAQLAERTGTKLTPPLPERS